MPQEVFTWDVALVEPQQVHEASTAEVTPAQEPSKPTPTPAVPAPSQPKKLTQKVQPREVTPVHQTVDTSRAIEQMVAVQTRTETVAPFMEQQPSEVQQVEQSVDEPVVPVVQQEAANQPEISEAPIQPVEAHAVETTLVVRDPELSDPPAPAMVATSDAKPVARESAPHTAMATSPAAAAKVDHGWLAESLRRRLAEIKRYPSSARLNGQEGKVVLRAVIRADGHLSEVKVHRSSGHMGS